MSTVNVCEPVPGMASLCQQPGVPSIPVALTRMVVASPSLTPDNVNALQFYSAMLMIIVVVLFTMIGCSWSG